jgi:hypothetical protein
VTSRTPLSSPCEEDDSYETVQLLDAAKHTASYSTWKKLSTYYDKAEHNRCGTKDTPKECDKSQVVSGIHHNEQPRYALHK